MNTRKKIKNPISKFSVYRDDNSSEEIRLLLTIELDIPKSSNIPQKEVTIIAALTTPYWYGEKR